MKAKITYLNFEIFWAEFSFFKRKSRIFGIGSYPLFEICRTHVRSNNFFLNN